MPRKLGVFRKLPAFRAARGELSVADHAVNYTLSLMIFALALTLRFWLEPLLPPGFPYLTFFPAVVVTGFLYGVSHGALVAVLAGFSSWYFFIPPVHTFDIGDGTLVAMALYIFVVGTDLFLISLMISGYKAELLARQALQRMAAEQEVMAHELHHRLKNVFATMNAIISLSQRHAATADELAARLKDRLQSMSRSSLMLRKGHNGEEMTLRTVIRQALEPFGAADSQRICLKGPKIVADGQSVVVLSLILHELGTNAAKYGALSSQDGRISVHWRETVREKEDGAEKEPVLEILWREEGGPPPSKQAAKTKGFGSTLISRVLATLNGEAAIEFPATGAVVALLVPMQAIVAGFETAEAAG